MKKINKSFLYKFSSLCIALGGIIFYHGPCLMFFGEPEFKEKQKKKLQIIYLRFVAFFLNHNPQFETITPIPLSILNN